jgi:hypothetical protein
VGFLICSVGLKFINTAVRTVLRTQACGCCWGILWAAEICAVGLKISGKFVLWHILQCILD